MINKPKLLWVGTSNIVLPGNKSIFPPIYQSGSRLHYYGSLFNTVEINSSFYKIPLKSTTIKWAADVPDDFRFTLKLNKAITHSKALQFNATDLTNFFKSAEGIGTKKGSLLLQFPGSISINYFSQVEYILKELKKIDSNSQWKKALEFREAGWYISETTELLDQYGAAMVLHDYAKGRLNEVQGKANFVYIRFHGPKGDYRDSYSENYIAQIADQIKGWLKKGKEVYAYFNNTIGSAFQNAVKLKSLLENY